MLTPPAAAIPRGYSDSHSTTTIAVEPGTDSIVLPDGMSLAGAHFVRVGGDLVVSAPDGQHVTVLDYFNASPVPALVGADGGSLDGALVSRLAPLAPGQVAQVGPSISEAIGEVDNVTGTVIATRADGSRVVLQPGDPIFQGDVLETGPDGAIGIVFADDTAFAMAANGRMVLDEMIYDPSTSKGVFSMSIVQGVFSFVSGDIAKNDPDAMVVHTPVATIGIRGTQVGIDFSDGHTLSVAAMEELGGFVGEIVVSNDGGVMVLNRAGAYTVVTGLNVAPSDLAFLSDADIIRFFANALSHLPLAMGTENNYGVQQEGDLALLDDFTTAAGGEESVIGGTDDFIPVTNGSPAFNPVPTAGGGGSPFSGPGGGGVGGGNGNPGFAANDSPLDLGGGFGEGTGLGSPGNPFAGFDSTFIGTNGNDTYPSGAQDNSGRDFVYGGGGNDTLTGGDDDDVVYGGDGDDVIIGGHGNGKDKYFGGNPGAEFGLGTNGEDNDTFGDTLIFPSTTEGVVVNLNNVNEVVILPSGVIQLAAANTSTDLLPLADQDPTANHIEVDEVHQFEHVAGGSGGDVLIGDENDNQLWGEWKDPSISVFGDDVLFAGSGNDVVIGSGGDDFVLVGASADAPGNDGDDSYFGGFVIEGTDGDAAPTFTADNSRDGGVNTISYQLTSNGVDVDLGAGTGQSVSGADDEVGTDHLFDFANVIGGDGDDTLRGDGAANRIVGGFGNDRILGRGGDDELHGGAGDDTLDGGEGNDLLSGGEGIDTADYSAATGAVTVNLATGQASGGGIGVDTLESIEGVLGGGGDDILTGSTAADILNGGAGNDTIDGGGGGADVLIGGAGDDTIRSYGGSTIDGGAGIDTVSFGAVGTLSYKDLLIGKDGETLTVTFPTGVVDTLTQVEFLSFDDGGLYEVATGILRGTDDSDGMAGGDGDDIIDGAGGDDEISGGSGGDVLRGGAGDDTLDGGGGDDQLDGGEGSDTASYAGAASGVAVNLGGSERQIILADGTVLVLAGATAVDVDPPESGGIGQDSLIGVENIQGSAFADIIVGDGSANRLFGGAGNDIMAGGGGGDVIAGEGGSNTIIVDLSTDADRFFGGYVVLNPDGSFSNGGRDTGSVNTIDFHLATQAVTVTLTPGRGAPGTASGIEIGNDELFEFSNIVGGSGNDVLTGENAANFIFGGAGSDKLFGKNGDDRLDGGEGDDEVDGGEGNDTLFGSRGNDTLDGGAGIDTVDYSHFSSDVVINLSGNEHLKIGAGTAVAEGFVSILKNVEDATGGDGNDHIYGGKGGATLKGGGGDDELIGGIGNDSLLGGTGEDSLSGAEGDDVLHGNAGNDSLLGGAGNDTLNGGAGDDTLDGGEGNDTVSYFDAASSVEVSLMTDQASGTDSGNDTLISIENIVGSHHDDILTGDDESNRLLGSLGSDILIGNGGDDMLDGGDGDDELTGGNGNDVFFFYDSNDGHDTIFDFGIAEKTGALGDRIFLRGADAGEVSMSAGDGTGIRQLIWTQGDDTLTVDIHGDSADSYSVEAGSFDKDSGVVVYVS